MTYYTIQSLDDLATSLRWQKSAKRKAECKIKADVWIDAANIIRNTIFIPNQN